MTCVVIPTYNERDNIRPMVEALLGLEISEPLNVLVVDDNSPDGTGVIADKLATENSRVAVLHRTEKAGLGKAYVAGFKCALEYGATRVVQMDCDFSHDPAALPSLLAEEGDLVIGSRYVEGGSTPGWPFKRRLISRAGGLFIRVVTGMPIKDPTGGFKVWKRELLEKMDLDSIASAGYSFQLEMNHRAWKLGAKIIEHSITFTDRTRGVSKITAGIATESIKIALKLHR
ncbi:MAG: polyprenol monophosphomannose synthase [Kiritimatiellae bacterium]|nr:polyprenol monophosphomannose synthase [Kiritimatiellia bacterium]